MATSVNHLSYTPIEPIEIPKADYSHVKKIATRVAIMVVSIFLGLAIGGFIALTEMGLSLTTGLVLGGITGILMGLWLRAKANIPTQIAHYRIQTLEQMKGTTSNERVLEIISNLRDFFIHPFVRFNQTYQHHLLHRALTLITDSVDRSRKDIQKVWRTFLGTLHGKLVTNADGKQIQVDMSVEYDRLEGRDVKTAEPSLLNPESETFEKDLKQIEEIEKVSLGTPYSFARQFFSQGFSVRCHVLKEKEGEKILGFGILRKDEAKYTLSEFARRPEYARLGIGHQLMHATLSSIEVEDRLPVFLNVRASNPAKRLYEYMGFVEKERVNSYYPEAPQEDAFVMELDWEAYDSLVEKLKRQAKKV